MRWWKIVGLAGLAGVAGTGVLIARAERTRRAYTPAQVRALLHARAEEAETRVGTAADPAPGPPDDATHNTPPDPDGGGAGRR